MNFEYYRITKVERLEICGSLSCVPVLRIMGTLIQLGHLVDVRSKDHGWDPHQSQIPKAGSDIKSRSVYDLVSAPRYETPSFRVIHTVNRVI